MSSHDDDFTARIKRVRVQSGQFAPMPDQGRAHDDHFDEKTVMWTILRPQLAVLLGAIALVLGRSIAMNQLMIEPNTDLLGLGEGVVVILFLGMIGLLFGKSDHISHGALAIGAAFAFLGERYYIPVIPDLMTSIYNPQYVALVFLNG